MSTVIHSIHTVWNDKDALVEIAVTACAVIGLVVNAVYFLG